MNTPIPENQTRMSLTFDQMKMISLAHINKRIAAHDIVKSTQHGSVEEVREQLKNPLCLVDQQDSKGATAVHHAVVNGSSKMLRLLLKANASIDIRDSRQLNALHWAAQFFQYTGYPWGYCESKKIPEDTVLMLLSHRDMNIEAVDDYGRTALHLTMHGGSFEMAKLLMQLGANKEAKCKNGWTPLLCAIQMSTAENHNVMPTMLSDKLSRINVDMVQLLLSEGVSLDVLDDNGNTPFEVAYKLAVHSKDQDGMQSRNKLQILNRDLIGAEKKRGSYICNNNSELNKS